MSRVKAPTGRTAGEDAVYLLALLAVCGVLFFWGLGQRSLWETDEARYAEIAREMITSGDWITPRLNFVKYFEKPALTYWLVALSFKAFGVSAASARLTPAVFATLSVLVVFFLGRRLWDSRSGLCAALCLATSLMFAALSRVLLVDMVLCFGVVLALWGAWALRDGLGWGRYAFWGGCAIGFLTKGLLGPGLPMMVVTLMGLLTWEWAWLKNLARLRGLAFFILLCAPWVLLISLSNPEFPRFFFIEENLGRLLTTEHQRYQPFYFYFLLLPAAFFPWVAFLPWAIAQSWPGANWRGAAARPWLYVVVWFVSFLLFLSLSQSKMLHYALPMLPPLALLLGRPLAGLWPRAGQGEPPRGALYGLVALAALLLAAGAALLALPAVNPDISFQQAGALLLVVPLFLSALGLAVFVVRRRVWAVWACPLAVFLALALATAVVSPQLDEYRSVEGLVAPLKGRLGPDDTLVNYGDYYHGTVFYSGRRAVVVHNWGELDFGRAQDPEAAKWFLPDDAAFIRLLKKPQGRVLALAETQSFLRFKDKTQGTPGLLLFEWARLGDKSLFSNRPR